MPKAKRMTGWTKARTRNERWCRSRVRAIASMSVMTPPAISTQPTGSCAWRRRSRTTAPISSAAAAISSAGRTTPCLPPCCRCCQPASASVSAAKTCCSVCTRFMRLTRRESMGKRSMCAILTWLRAQPMRIGNRVRNSQRPVAMATKAAPRAGLRRALDQKQPVLFSQPTHELGWRGVVAAEALLRARRRSGEIRSAAALTKTAEEGPDLYRLNSWLIRRAFRDAASWQRGGAPEGGLKVNISPRELEERGLSTRLRKLAKLTGIDPRTVRVEITETSFIAKPGAAARALRQVKSVGVELWLDDFGTGHSSLSHLLLFPLDGLKLPAEFVKPVGSDGRARTLVGRLIELAHDLGLRVTAEGVENGDQLAALRAARCDFVQGFLFSKPMPVERFCDFLRRPL